MVLLILAMSFCQAADLSKYIKVDRLFLETEKRSGVNREYYLVNRESARYDLNLGLDLEIPASFYYNNRVTSTTDDNQFRFVGYRFEVGTRIIKGLEVYFQHFSGHALDESFDEDFPQQNKIGIRFNLIRRK
jgi:hypothetical protein